MAVEKDTFLVLFYLSVTQERAIFVIRGIICDPSYSTCTLQISVSLLYFSPQAALLNSFPDIFDELLQMFTVQEVAEYVRGTLGSMPSTVDIGQSMDVVKLQSIARTVESRLFFFPGETNVKVYAKCFVSLKIPKQPYM